MAVEDRIDPERFTAEENYLREPHTELTPEEIFEGRWAFTVIDRAVRWLHEDALVPPYFEDFTRATKV